LRTNDGRRPESDFGLKLRESGRHKPDATPNLPR
jgi:hypothetical protein